MHDGSAFGQHNIDSLKAPPPHQKSMRTTKKNLLPTGTTLRLRIGSSSLPPLRDVVFFVCLLSLWWLSSPSIWRKSSSVTAGGRVFGVHSFAVLAPSCRSSSRYTTSTIIEQDADHRRRSVLFLSTNKNSLLLSSSSSPAAAAALFASPSSSSGDTPSTSSNAEDDRAGDESSTSAAAAESSSSSSSTTPDEHDARLMKQVFPVLSRIQGIYWEGTCRYVNGDLEPQTQLKLTGGTHYSLNVVKEGEGEEENKKPQVVTCTLTSFLVFPDGRTRQVQMRGKRRRNDQRPSLRLDSTSTTGNAGGVGPIYMVLTEVGPDTVLLNEVETETGRIILTSTLSLVENRKNAEEEQPQADTSIPIVEELIQSSHEVGESRTTSSNMMGGSSSAGIMAAMIEGHQVWRFQKRSLKKEDGQQQKIVDESATSWQ